MIADEATSTRPTEGVGALDALANYWLSRLAIEDVESDLKPEWNLSEFSAAALYKLLEASALGEDEQDFCNGVTDGFEFGLRFAHALEKAPFADHGPMLREMIGEIVDSRLAARRGTDGKSGAKDSPQP